MPPRHSSRSSQSLWLLESAMPSSGTCHLGISQLRHLFLFLYQNPPFSQKPLLVHFFSCFLVPPFLPLHLFSAPPGASSTLPRSCLLSPTASLCLPRPLWYWNPPMGNLWPCPFYQLPPGSPTASFFPPEPLASLYPLGLICLHLLFLLGLRDFIKVSLFYHK